ncbi:MAG TPA: type VI secretion system contractile sheath large subunit, partial [Caldimonas sp.]
MQDDTWTPDFGQLDAAPPEWAAKRPLRIAVLGDFSAGASKGRLDTGSDLARRKLIPVEFDNLEDTLARLDVKLALPLGDGGEGVEVEFADLDGFHPDALYRSLPVFSALVDLRKRLNNTATFPKAAAEVQAMAGTGTRRASKSGARRSRSGAPSAGAKLSDFARLVGLESEVRTDAPVNALLKRIVGPFVKAAPDPKRDALVATVDAALSDAMRAVLHQAEFQNLEALWRGLDMLLRRVETGPALQVLLIDLSAEEFAADLSSASDLSETGLYALLVDKPSQEKAGGVSLICGLYQFEATPPHAELLGRMAKIAAQANAPFITSINAETLTDRKVEPHPLVVEAMQALKALPEASHLALMAPRFMLRHPYGKRADPISAFDFEEFTPQDGLRGMLWGHPAIIAACLLAAPTRTLSIGDLPFHFVVDADGDQIALPCTERLVASDAAARLRLYGISALMAHKGQPELRVAGLESLGGQALGLQATAKVAPRGSVSTSIRTTVPERGPAPAPAAARARSDAQDEEAAPAEAVADSEGDSAASSDTNLDDLLKSLGGDDTAST